MGSAAQTEHDLYEGAQGSAGGLFATGRPLSAHQKVTAMGDFRGSPAAIEPRRGSPVAVRRAEHLADRRLLAVLLIVASFGLLIRLAVLPATLSLGLPVIDEQHYATLAQNLVRGHGFGWAPGEPTSIRPPLYPLVLAATWKLAGDGNLLAVRGLQFILGAITAGAVYLIGVRLGGRGVALGAATVTWVYPALLFSNFQILTESLFTALLVGFVYLTIALLERPRQIIALAGGLVLGLAALARSVLWPFPLIFCPLLLLVLRGPIRRRLVISLLVLVGYLLIITPWAVRNTALQGVPTVVDTMGGLNLYMGNYANTPEDRMWAVVDLGGAEDFARAIQREYPNQTLTEGQKDKWGQRKALEYMLANPGQTLRRSLIRFADFWGLEREFIAGVQQGLYHPPTWFAVLAAVAMTVSYVLVALTGAAGIWLARPEWRAHVILLLPILVIMGAHTLIFGHSRYHIPLIPILAIYGAAFVTGWREHLRNASRPALVGAATSCAVLIFIWARQILIVDAERLMRLFNG